MLERFRIIAIAACFIAALARGAPAQTIPVDSVVRVHLITVDSTWYVTGQLVAITGDSVVIRMDVTNARVAFERIHVLSVEQQVRGGSVGRSALIGCVVLGGAFGLGALADRGGGNQGGDGDIGGPVVAAVVGVAGCLVGGLIGALIGTANRVQWRTITLPPRTGTEGDTAAVRITFGETFPQHLM